jgi:hypothetical protein
MTGLQAEQSTSAAVMLHRTPSGAQKKIRQRLEERSTHSRSFSSGNSEVESTSSSMGYRNLVDSNGYRSILPENNWQPPTYHSPYSRPTLVNPISPEERFEKPDRPPRQTDSVFSSSSELRAPHCVMPLSSNVHSHDFASNGFNGIGKPMVQVHPMPAPRSSLLSGSPPETLKKQPPPVPRKPQTLRQKSETANTSFDSSFTQELEIKCSKPSTMSEKLDLSTANFSIGSPSIFSSSKTLSSAYSTDSLHLLCASPSLLNLQNSLNHAYYNPEQFTNQRLEELESQRLESIQKLSKKVKEREEDLSAVMEELEHNENIRKSLLQSISPNESLISRLNIHVVQFVRLTQLETRLELQNEKLQNISGANDEDFLAARRRRLDEQLEDASFVRSSFDVRDAQLEEELRLALDSDDLMMEWRFYKTTLQKLNIEKKQIEDKIAHVRAQLRTLTSTAIVLPEAKNDNGVSHSSPTFASSTDASFASDTHSVN